MKSKYCVKFFKQVRMHVCLRFENCEGVIHVLEGGEPVVAIGKIPRLHLFVAQKFVQIEVVFLQKFFKLLVTETGLHRRAAFARHFDEFLNAGHVRREEMIIGKIEEQGAPFRCKLGYSFHEPPDFRFGQIVEQSQTGKEGFFALVEPVFY